MVDVHKVFVSYHHENDQKYRERFEKNFRNVIVSKSVNIGDIDPHNKTETVRQLIRDNYLRDSTVTVVLIGTETWKRKHIDWEISSSLRDTGANPRSGLIGFILPTHSNYGSRSYSPSIIPPRLHDNIQCKYASIHHWNENPTIVVKWIHDAFSRRRNVNPDNSRPLFRNNQSGNQWTD